MKIYFISGMAADSRVFRNIKLPTGFEPVYLEWVPYQSHETLEQYALRMSEGIDRSQPFGLLGLSMGGMMVCEIAKVCKPLFTILISSIPLSGQLPFYYRFLGALRLHYIVPVSFFQKVSILKRLFTAETKEEKHILRAMIRSADPGFIKWSMKAILDWRNTEAPDNLIHIHGSRDELLPCRFTQPTYRINKAGHLMVLTRAREINELLERELGKYVRRES